MIQSVFCIAIYIFLAFILLFQVKRNDIPKKDDLFFSLNSLRGIFALEIVIGHCVRYESCPLTPLGNFMLISVGYFFFVSGYGLARSYHTKPGYLDSFLKHRIFRLLILAIEALIIVTLIAYISPIDTDFKNIPTDPLIFAKSALVRTNWYMRELMLLYICFFIVFRFVKKHRVSLLCTFIVIICAILYMNGYTRCWFASIICFPMGIVFCENIDLIMDRLKNLSGKLIALFFTGLGLIFSLLNYPQLTGQPFEVTEMIYAFANNILCIGFILLLITILIYLKPGNKILSLFTSIATPMYLFQFIFVAIAEKADMSYPVKTLFVLGTDIALSYILKKASELVSQKLH